MHLPTVPRPCPESGDEASFGGPPHNGFQGEAAAQRPSASKCQVWPGSESRAFQCPVVRRCIGPSGGSCRGPPSLHSPTWPTLLKSPGPHPTGIWDPQPGSCSWAGPEGASADMMSPAHMCWLCAVPAPVELSWQLQPLATAGPQVQAAGTGAGSGGGNLKGQPLPRLCSSGYSWTPVPVSTPRSAESQIPPLQNGDDNSPHLPSRCKPSAGRALIKQVNIAGNSLSGQPRGTSCALLVFRLPICKVGL